MDKDARILDAGSVLFVSLCRSDTKGIYYTPDNGYVFPATATVLKKIKSIKRSKRAAKNPTACAR